MKIHISFEILSHGKMLFNEKRRGGMGECGMRVWDHDEDDEKKKQIEKVINDEIMKTRHNPIRQHIKAVLSTSMLTRYSGNGKLFGT